MDDKTVSLVAFEELASEATYQAKWYGKYTTARLNSVQIVVAASRNLRKSSEPLHFTELSDDDQAIVFQQVLDWVNRAKCLGTFD